MIYKVLTYGHPILTAQALSVRTFSDKLKNLIDDMFSTMYAYSGVGLAAPQIGVNKRIAIVDISSGSDESQKIVMINPEIIAKGGSNTVSEGCLSIPGFYEHVSRSRKVTVRAQDATGEWFEKEAEGYLAQAVQHEVEHLSGKLYIDHISSLKRSIIKRKIRNANRKYSN